MAKVLFITIPEKGHINPMMGLAISMKEALHDVFFWSAADCNEQTGIHGIPCYFPEKKDTPEITKGAAFIQLLKDPVWLRNWIKTLVVDAVTPQIDYINEVVAKKQPDIMVIDPMVYAAAIVATERHIPWIGVSNSLNPVTPWSWKSELSSTLKSLDSQRRLLFTSRGLSAPDFKISDVQSPYKNYVFTSEAYAQIGSYHSNIGFLGASFHKDKYRGDENGDFSIPKTDSKKTIYMSLGSQVYHHPQWFKKVALALHNLGYVGIFSVNELMHDTSFLQELPKNIFPFFYVNQLEILSVADLVITHGGANSVMETLAFGLPVLISPICNDQFLQAEFITKNQVGQQLDIEKATPDQIELLITELLDKNQPYIKQARYFKETFDNCMSLDEAGQEIISICQP